MNDLRKDMFYRIAGPVLFCLALLVYVFTLSAGPFPGESAYQVAQMSGVEPRLVPGSTILFWIGRLLASGPVSSLVLRFNLFSALCGAASVWLMFQIVSLFVIASIDVKPVNYRNTLFSAVAAGTVAALSMMFAGPFWRVSTRFHGAAFHVLLFLGMMRFLIAALTNRSQKRLVTFSFLYGLCIVEYPPFIPFAFLSGPFIIFWLWVFEEFEWKTAMRLVVAVLCGLMFYFAAAWSFYGSMIYGFMEDMTYFKVIWIIWRDQYYFLSAILPQSGWLIVITFTAVPWLCALFLARRGLNEDPNWSLRILHLVLAVCAFAVLFGVEFIRKPMEEASRTLVMPYVLAASVFGYSAAYWYRMPLAIIGDTDSVFFTFMRKFLGNVLLAPFVIMVLILPFVNFESANGRVAGFANRYCDRIIESMSGCRWLISDGSLDYNIMLRARESGHDISVINLRRAFNDTYMQYISMLTDNEITQNYIEIGLVPMLTAWIRSDNDLYKSIAVFTQPDLWRAFGYRVIPHKLVFKGMAQNDNIDPAVLAEEHQRFWNDDMQFMFKNSKSYGSLGPLHSDCRRHMGLIANNIGVMMQDAGDERTAFDFYTRAREMDPENVSALLNQSLMVDSGYITTQADEIKSELEKVAEERGRHLGIWSLSHRYGYVRHPEAFTRQGMTWAMSGRPDMALDGLRRAEGLLPEKGKRVLQGMIAQVYFSSGRTEQSADIYRNLLAQNPNDPAALIGMVEVLVQNGDFDKAREYLIRAEAAGVPANLRDAQWASIAVSMDDFGRARIIIENALLNAPDDINLLVRLAMVLDQQRDNQALESCLDRIEHRAGGRFTAEVLRGDFAIKKRDVKSAILHFERALTHQPGSTYVIEKLLRINVLVRNRSKVTEYAGKLLNIDSENYFAHYAIGTIRMSERKYNLAEASYRKSIECRKSPEALNDLAYLLFIAGKYQEAESSVRAALELDGNFHVAWDTLGEICMKTGRLDEAENAFQKAIALTQTDMRVHLHMAEVLVARGRKQEARHILDMLFEKMNQLPLEDQNKVVELRKQVRN